MCASVCICVCVFFYTKTLGPGSSERQLRPIFLYRNIRTALTVFCHIRLTTSLNTTEHMMACYRNNNNNTIPYICLLHPYPPPRQRIHHPYSRPLKFPDDPPIASKLATTCWMIKHPPYDKKARHCLSANTTLACQLKDDGIYTASLGARESEKHSHSLLLFCFFFSGFSSVCLTSEKITRFFFPQES